MWQVGLVLAVLLPLPVMAQTDDRSYLTALLEDNLSGAGRKVTITGFSGALSSQASLTEMTIADAEGVWLTLRDVALDWNRAALFSGAVSVNALTAGEIILERMPISDDAPTAEAATFALPELPVSVEIGTIAAEKIVLGAGVLGTAVEGRIEAALSLAGGEGAGNLVLERTDTGPKGRIVLTASYANAGQRLAVDLDASEASGGIASTLIGLPGDPSVALTIKGAGPLSDFTADVALTTDAVDRLAGKVQLTGQQDGATGFSADLAGDLAPLFLPAYAEFFGNAVTLSTKGLRWPDGRLDLAELDVTAKALHLNGALMLAADGLPQRFSLVGQIAAPDGSAVLLPLTTDQPVRVDRATLRLGFDATQGEGWSADVALNGLYRADFRASAVHLTGSGRIARPGGVRQIGGNLRFDAEGVQPTDAALARALGTVIWGDALGFWREGDGVLTLSQFNMAGDGYQASVAGTVAGLKDALRLAGRASATVSDLSRLSDLTGQPLGGAAEITLRGNGSPITGAFDLEARALGQDMRVGIPELDSLLQGAAAVDGSVLRDTNGTVLRSLTVTATNLTATASGRLATAGSDIVADLDFRDLRSLGNGYRGQIAGKAALTGTLTEGRLTFEATGSGLGIGQPQADTLLAGDSRLEVILAVQDGAVQIEKATLNNPQIEAQATGDIQDGQQTVDLTARMKNLALLLPEFPGALVVTGRAVQTATGVQLDLAGQGPGQIEATAKGQIAPEFDSADVVIKGTAQAALANAFVAPRAISGRLGFDLRLNGPLALASVTGPVTLTDGRLADPNLKFAFETINAKADLARGRAMVTATAAVTTGGQIAVDGSVGLDAPFSADLAIDVRNVTLRDPDLYEATLTGGVTLQGPLAAGAVIAGEIALSGTELRVPSTGFGGAGGLPGLDHVNEPGDVRATRSRAGLIAVAAGDGVAGPAYGLDVTLSAPNRVFLRGRGLDAELGGELRLLGNTAAVQPVGAFNLIRGRLEILGKRLELSEALLQMEGALVPFLRIVASIDNNGITSGVVIEGPATDPKVTFTSSPQLPEEEVLAQLLFGQTLQDLSALQALQLANAVATLAGKGGEGVVGRLRKGFGLDNLDVKTDAAGGASVTAGKYLTERIYSEVTVDQTGQSQINLNLDVTDSITLRGRARSDGTAGLGVVLEKDY